MNASANQKSWTYRGGAERIAAQFAPRLGGNSHRITAEIEVGNETPNGVIFANGGRTAGYALFVKNGQLIYEGTGRLATSSTPVHSQIIASESLPKGKSVIEVVATRIKSPAGDQDQDPFNPFRRAKAPAASLALMLTKYFTSHSSSMEKQSAPVSSKALPSAAVSAAARLAAAASAKAPTTWE